MKSGKKSATISKKNLDSKPAYNEKCLKTKILQWKINIFTITKYQKKTLDVFVYQ